MSFTLIHFVETVRLKIMNGMVHKKFSVVSKCIVWHTIILLLNYYKALHNLKMVIIQYGS